MSDKVEPTENEREPLPTYEGSRFPWWLVLIWIAFFVFSVVYLILWMFPDLKLWLTDTAAQIWK